MNKLPSPTAVSSLGPSRSSYPADLDPLGLVPQMIVATFQSRLLDMILGDEARIAAAIESGAAWEIWMQVELYVLARQNGLLAAREVAYPKPNDSLRLDLLAGTSKGGPEWAIELKVESATNAGRALLKGVQSDMEKIQGYKTVAKHYVVGIGYSDKAKSALSDAAGDNALYRAGRSIGVLVVKV